jgi:hypothetical protein
MVSSLQYLRELSDLEVTMDVKGGMGGDTTKCGWAMWKGNATKRA